MNTLLVTYDLLTPGKDYDRLWSFLESQTNWAKPVRSVYLTKTHQSASDFRDSLMSYIDRNDKALVIDVTSDVAGWTTSLGTSITNWIKTNL